MATPTYTKITDAIVVSSDGFYVSFIFRSAAQIKTKVLRSD